MSNALKSGSLLQGGRYKILDVLGQGGFGITYMAEQTGLDRTVAIKEFFMSGMCSRDVGTSYVTLGVDSGYEFVMRFREKFLKEARNIARFNHPNIVRIIDVFEENGTAYYVMEYAPCGSLSDRVRKEGYLSEPVATRYIKQIASALDYIHRQNVNHLDVKPGNIMLNEKDETVLIDFGLAKQYDAESGGQTSTTPVGISEGYAPMEQYMQGGVAEFSPETDVYALGATLFKLLTGKTPPNASYMQNFGLPKDDLKKNSVSLATIYAISKAMQGKKDDRFSSATDFAAALPSADKRKLILYGAIGVAVVALVAIIIAFASGGNSESPNEVMASDSNSEEVDSSGVVAEKPREDTIKTFTVNGVDFDMIYVKGGSFIMGATSEPLEAFDEERAPHQVTIDDYYIGKTEVTQALWYTVMGGRNPSFYKGDNLPVESVSWNDCQEFVEKLNALTGQHFRLPTEAEWEFAARGGNNSKNFMYSGSNNLGVIAWCGSNSGGMPHNVAEKKTNELGIYDMSGNVWEWCQDWYGSYGESAVINPTGPESGSYRVYRGGSYANYDSRCRTICCHYGLPTFVRNCIGLRLALSE